MKDADRKVIVETTLRNFDLRPTYPRKALILMLSESGNIHFSAAEAHQRLLDNGNKVSLATVYNNLKEFVDAGIIRSIAGHHRQVIFDTNVEPHHHVVNRRTGMISDTDQIDYLLKETFPPRRRSRAMGMEFAEPSPYACRVNQRP